MTESLFKGMDEKDILKLMKNLDAKIFTYEKNRKIITSINHNNAIGILLNGTANIERYDYNGNKTIIEKLEKNSVFGEIFFSVKNDITVTSTSNSRVLLIDYDNLIKNLKNINFINNIFNLLSNKMIELNTRIEILSKRSIKEKILTYFSMLAKNNKSFILPFTYTELADYLSIDRSAMMREIKKLRDSGLIKTNGRNIKLIKQQINN